MKLSEVRNNETVVITKVLGHGSFRRRIAEMGFVKGKEVSVIKNAPLKDPIEYKVLNYNVSLRRSEAALIEVVTSEEARKQKPKEFNGIIDLETLKTTAKEKGKIINIALVGNPNCGKTTIFNYASGSKEHVGNYSGVTVDSKEAQFKQNGYTFNLVDLPGTYSLTAYTPEELYVRQYIKEELPDLVINVIDSSNLERNLYLTTQLIDMDIKVIIALNMYDELVESGASFNFEKLARMIGAPIIPTTASRGEGIKELFDKAINVYEDLDPTVRHIHINYGSVVEKSISRVREKIRESKPISDKISSRFLAIKLLEADKQTNESLASYPNFDAISATTNQEISRIENLLKEDTETIITDSKYGFIDGALKETYQAGPTSDRDFTHNIDKFLTNKYLGFPIFLLFMFTSFYATFQLGAYPMNWIDQGITLLGSFAERITPDGILKDLLVDGIINGVGSITIFIPNILILFFFISFMEDTGYMARAAFLMDKLMHRMGLHGRSFIPMVMGFGCNVPAIMATRTLRNRSDRLLTMLIIPFMTCSARLPVYILLIGAFFTSYPATVLIGLYLIGIILAVIVGRIFRKTLFKTQESPFVMELPPYRIPTLRNTLIHMWDKAWMYIKKIATVILLAVIIIWAMEYFPRTSVETEQFNGAIAKVEQEYGSQITQLGQSQKNEIEQITTTRDQKIRSIEIAREANRLENSYLGKIGKMIAPVMQPLGFDWKMSVSLLAGVAAKEIVVSTMGVLYQADEVSGESMNLQNKLHKEIHASGPNKGQHVFTPVSALSFLIFVLIYFPCIAVIITIRKESGSWKWALFTATYTTALAWLTSFFVFQIGSLIF